TLHCPQTRDNVGFVNAELLDLMKREAFFINAARGGLVNENALAQALNNGSIAAAAVDVVSIEPIRPDNPLLSAQNCLISPHIAWATLGARQTLMAETIKNIKAYISGNSINVVNTDLVKWLSS
ncbi:MAG: D-2-hydroxyacid dehydrogenase, partial [Desulfobacterales bacterium]|nr:D-2-hydroxyacid dehydrogenase [Desulfobacterales bacterium]